MICNARYAARVLYESAVRNGGKLRAYQGAVTEKTGLPTPIHEEDYRLLREAVALLIDSGVAVTDGNGPVVDFSLTRMPPMDDWDMDLPWEEGYRPPHLLSATIRSFINGLGEIDSLETPKPRLEQTPTHSEFSLLDEHYYPS